MKKLQKLKLEALNNMLSREEMKKISGGYGPPVPCVIFGGNCSNCCPGSPCRWDSFAKENICAGNG